MKLSEYLKKNGLTTKEWLEMQDRKSKGVKSLGDIRREEASSFSQSVAELEKLVTDTTSAYNSRYFDKDGNYVSDYRDDYDVAYQDYSAKKSAFDTHKTNVENYLKENGNRLSKEYVTQLTDYLKTASDTFDSMHKVYQGEYDFRTNFKTEYDYNAYLMNNTEGVDSDSITTRKTAYATNNARIDELNNAIENFKFDNEGKWVWTMNPDTNVPMLKYEVTAKNQSEYDTLVAEKEKLEAEKRVYERGKKVNDDTFTQYSSNEDYATVSQNRDYKYPSIEGVKLIKASEDNQRNSTYPGEYSSYEYNPENYAITDPLGTYLNASEEDITWALDNMDTDDEAVRAYVKTISDGDLGGWEYLKPEEVDLYYYMWNRGLKEQAISYLNGMEVELDRRANVAQMESLEDASALELVFHNVASIPANIFGGGIGLVSDALALMQGNEINPYGTGHNIQNYAQNVRGATANDLNEWTNNAEFLSVSLGDAYQSVMSGVDSLVGSAIMGSSYAVIMGMGAASSKAKELYERGASNEQIVIGGLLSGVAEMVFEKISIDYFLENFLKSAAKTPAKAIMQALAQAGIEMSEEMATEIANTISDAVVMGSQSDWEKTIAKYKDLGCSDGEAMTKALWDIGGNVLESGIGGFISGGFMGGGGAAINYAKYTKDNGTGLSSTIKAGKDIKTTDEIGSLVEFAKSLGPDTKAAKLASKINEKSGAYEVGKLLQEIRGESLNKAVVNDIVSAIKEKGLMPADSKDVISGIENIVNGVGLSESQENLLGADTKIGKIVNEMLTDPDSIVNKRTNEFHEIAKRVTAGKALNEIDKLNAKAYKEQAKKDTATIIEEAENNLTEDERKALESKYETSAEGKTILTETGEAVDVESIEAITDGKMSLRLGNGEVVDAGDVSFSSDGESLIYSTISDMNVGADVANALLEGYKLGGNKVSARNYALGIKEAYSYGTYSIPFKEISTRGFAAALTTEQRSNAYNLGKAKAKALRDERMAKIKAQAKSETETKKQGRVILETENKEYTEIEKESISFMEKLCEALDIDIYVYESVIRNGQRVYKNKNGDWVKAPNGYYDAADGTIHIDLKAGLNTTGKNSTMLFTVAHELTHFIKDWSPEKFDTLAEFLMEQYGKKFVSVNDLVNAQIAKAKRQGRDIDYDTAYEEVVADSMSAMLADGKIIEKLALLNKKDSEIVEQMESFFSKAVNRLKDLYKNMLPTSIEGRRVMRMREEFEKFQSLFADALVDASKNYNNSEVKSVSKSEVKYSTKNTNIDKYGYNADNVSRANKQGELVNDYYYALDKKEWNIFYKNITEKHYLATAIKGTIAPITVNDKLIIAERLHTGKDAHDYVVIDAFQIQDTYEGDLLDSIIEAFDKGDLTYDRQTMYQKLSRVLKNNQSTGILARFDGDSQRYVRGDAEGVYGTRNEKIHRDSQEGIAGERVSLRDKSSVQEDNELLNLSNRDYVESDSKAVMTNERIDYLIEDSGAGKRVDYANSWITSISPTDFLNMTLTKDLQDRSNFDKYPSEWNEESTVDTYDYIGELKKNMRQTPYLAIDITTGKVDGHEGRHRMRALEKKGIASVEIRVEFRDEDGRTVKYSPDGKRLQIKDALKIKNQYSTGQSATINNVIPLNEDYRSEILANYGENNAKGTDIRYSERDQMTVETVNDIVFGEKQTEIVKTESGVKYQLRDNEKIGNAAINYNNNHKYVEAAILVAGVETMHEMAEVMLPYLEEDGILPPDIPGKTIFKNGSYGRSGENTTLCVRTLTYEDFKDRVAEKIGRPLTVSESLLVSQKIYDIATEPQCIYCYVAADRKAYDGYLGEYWNAMDKYIKALKNGGDSKALYEEYLNGRKDTNQQQKRWASWVALAKSGKEYISASDLTTKRKREHIISQKNAFSEQVKDAQRYAQSASWAKTVYDYRAYKGDILKMSQKFVDMLNSEYGLRMYSFSDYTPAFIVENMQMIIDASVKGLKSLAYTKDTDYAEIFAPSGQAINVSCFAKYDAATGTYVEDNRQGANWAKTKELRNQFDNVGAVMVCTSDEMVMWALKQDWVDVVIPYHIVKTGTTIANEYGWNNYTSESADKANGKVANIYPTEHNNSFETYSSLVKERGITPRFNRYYAMIDSGEITSQEYMKLVNEVRLPASKLSAVQPVFNLDAAKKSFGVDNDGGVIEGGFVDKGGYMGGWYRQGVDVNQEVLAVSKDIELGKSSLDVDYGMSKSYKAKVEEKYGIKHSDRDSDSDILYDSRDTEVIEAYEQVNTQLMRENAQLKKDVEYAKELVKIQKTLTHGKVLNPKSLEKAAKTLMTYANAKGDVAEFTSLLNDVYSHILSGEDVSWESISEASQEAINWLRQHEHVKRERDEYATEVLDYLRGTRISLSETQKQEAAYLYGSYNNFRKKNMGRFILTDSGVPLDTLWQELNELYPGTFDSSVSEGNQPAELVNVVEAMQNTYVQEDYFYEDEMVNQDLLTKIYDYYWNVTTLHTVADAKQAEINRLRAKHRQQMDNVKTSHSEKVDALRNEYKDKLSAMRRQYKEREQKKLAQKSKEYQESRSRAVENKEKTAMRHRIKKIANGLNRLLNRGTKEKNVKNGLRETVAKTLDFAELLFSTNVTNDEIIRNGIEYATETDKKYISEYAELLDKRDFYINQIEELSEGKGVDVAESIEQMYALIDKVDNRMRYLGEKLSKVLEIEKERVAKATMSDAIDTLVKAYDEIKNSEDEYIKNSYNDYVRERLAALSKNAGTTLIKNMSIGQLREVYDAFALVKYTIETANDLFYEGKRESLNKAVDSVQSEVMAYENKNKKDPVKQEAAIRDALDKFVWNELKPNVAFERLGSATLEKFYWDVVKAQRKYAQDIKEAQDFIENVNEEFSYKKWDTKTAKTFKLADGREFKLTLEDMMSIYAYSRREQAMDHITIGGFVFDENSTYKGKFLERKHAKFSDTYQVDLGLLQQIIAALTPEQQRYVEKVQGYLTKMGEKGNEVSRALFGIDIFNETVYFPLMSQSDYRSSVEEALKQTYTQVSLKNTGMTKQTTPHANNPIVLQGFSNVVAEHITKMAQYHAYVLPIENLQRVFNSSSKVTTGDTQKWVSTKAVIKSVFGEGGKNYLDQYITDLNGDINQGGAKNPLMQAFSTAKGVQVGANLSVIIQQPFAIIRAMDIINPKYFTGKRVKNNKGLKKWDLITKYSGAAVQKEIGGYDMGASRQTTDYLLGKKHLSDYTMIGAEKADVLGWSIIWDAVEREVSAEGGYEIGTEQYYNACGERFDEVVTKTQVYDSLNSRNAFMRSKHDSVKFITSFMGEPTTIVNMMYSKQLELYRAFKSKDKERIKQAEKSIARTGSILVISSVLTSLARAAVYAMRDDDEDETYAEKWAKHFGDALSDDINPLNLIPIGRDIMSTIEGWTVERPDMTLIADIITTFKKLTDEDASSEEWLNFAGAVANAFGLPIKNIYRDSAAIFNLFSMGDRETTDMGAAFEAGFEGDTEFTLKTRAEKAFKKGDTSGTKSAVNDMVKSKVASGKTEKEAKSAVKQSFTATYKDDYIKAYKSGDTEKMNDIRRFLYATGLWDNLNDLDNLLKKWRTE